MYNNYLYIINIIQVIPFTKYSCFTTKKIESICGKPTTSLDSTEKIVYDFRRTIAEKFISTIESQDYSMNYLNVLTFLTSFFRRNKFI